MSGEIIRRLFFSLNFFTLDNSFSYFLSFSSHFKWWSDLERLDLIWWSVRKRRYDPIWKREEEFRLNEEPDSSGDGDDEDGEWRFGTSVGRDNDLTMILSDMCLRQKTKRLTHWFDLFCNDDVIKWYDVRQLHEEEENSPWQVVNGPFGQLDEERREKDSVLWRFLWNGIKSRIELDSGFLERWSKEAGGCLNTDFGMKKMMMAFFFFNLLLHLILVREDFLQRFDESLFLFPKWSSVVGHWLMRKDIDWHTRLIRRMMIKRRRNCNFFECNRFWFEPSLDLFFGEQL